MPGSHCCDTGKVVFASEHADSQSDRADAWECRTSQLPGALATTLERGGLFCFENRCGGCDRQPGRRVSGVPDRSRGSAELQQSRQVGTEENDHVQVRRRRTLDDFYRSTAYHLHRDGRPHGDRRMPGSHQPVDATPGSEGGRKMSPSGGATDVLEYEQGNLQTGTNWWGAFVIGLAGTILVTGAARPS